MKQTFSTSGIPRLIADASKTSSRAETLAFAKLPKTLIPYGIMIAIVAATGKGRLYGKALVKTSGAAQTTIALKSVGGSPDFVVPFVPGDVVDIGANSDVTIISVDYTAKTIQTAAITVVADAGVTVKDGGETAKGVLYSEINNNDANWNDEDRQVAVIDYGIVYEQGCTNLDSAAKTALPLILFR